MFEYRNVLCLFLSVFVSWPQQMYPKIPVRIIMDIKFSRKSCVLTTYLNGSFRVSNQCISHFHFCQKFAFLGFDSCQFSGHRKAMSCTPWIIKSYDMSMNRCPSICICNKHSLMCSSSIAGTKQFLVINNLEGILFYRLENHRCFIIMAIHCIVCIGHLLAGINQSGRLQELTLIIGIRFLVYWIVLRCYLNRFFRFAAHFNRTTGWFGDGHIVCGIVEHILPPVVV